MKKERIILAFVAIIAGAIVASSIFYFYQQKDTKTGTSGETPTITIANDKAILEIETPENESVTNEKTVDLKGKSIPKSIIVLTTNSEDFVLTADENGAFEKTIALADDDNIFSVTAYTDKGKSETKEITVTKNDEEF